MVNRPRLSRLMCMTRSDRSLPAVPCELGNVAADDPAVYMIRMLAGVMQPVKEVRQPNGIGSLSVDRTIALTEFSQKLIA